MKRLGLSPLALVEVYKVLIRPCFDYTSVVYHSMLTAGQSELLERQQKKIFRVIFGWDLSYERALERAGVERHNFRRQGLVELFVLKLARNDK